jgi:mannose-6-phosphate isomerase-like protein (cupin superfamily)
VNAQDLRDFVFFQDERVTRRTVFETERLWSEVVCLNLNQSLGPITDPDSDAIFTIVSGEAVVQVERRRRRLKQWRSILVPAGSEVTVTNASPEPLVVMVVAAPPPSPTEGE